ncbi:hypothetical protein KIW84_035916 [Lathyrus oleraceus]|uniref:DUF7906 domain-containing protein n=1 Tax=Pisum sativum TaxID=3888 RepID=A0A9D4Y578_PEA|nr:hypothetical protein KIW84_035916 [Pisum sativum]
MRTQKVDGSLALEVWLGFNLLLQQGFKTGCETDVVLQSGGIGFEVASSVSRALDTNRNRLGTSADGGGATQVWLSSGRFVVIDLSAGPYTYGKIEAEEGSVSSRTLPRLRNVVRLSTTASYRSSNDIFLGPLASLVSTTVEHVIAPGVRLETVDLTSRLLVPIIVLQNHNR